MSEPQPETDEEQKPDAGREAEPQEVERRWTPLAMDPIRIEERADGGQKIVGMAAIYYDGTPRTEYELWEGVKERIKHGAFSALLKAGTDTRALFNHDPDNLLGRTVTDTLKLKSTRFGLEYEIMPPDTQTARDVVALLERGDLTGSSFSFLIGEETWKEDDEGNEIREIKQVSKLFDVGPVTFPAYEATTANMRSLETWRAERVEELEEARKAEQAEEETKQAADVERRRRFEALKELAT